MNQEKYKKFLRDYTKLYDMNVKLNNLLNL